MFHPLVITNSSDERWSSWRSALWQKQSRFITIDSHVRGIIIFAFITPLTSQHPCSQIIHPRFTLSTNLGRPQPRHLFVLANSRFSILNRVTVTVKTHNLPSFPHHDTTSNRGYPVWVVGLEPRMTHAKPHKRSERWAGIRGKSAFIHTKLPYATVYYSECRGIIDITKTVVVVRSGRQRVEITGGQLAGGDDRLKHWLDGVGIPND